MVTGKDHASSADTGSAVRRSGQLRTAIHDARWISPKISQSEPVMTHNAAATTHAISNIHGSALLGECRDATFEIEARSNGKISIARR